MHEAVMNLEDMISLEHRKNISYRVKLEEEFYREDDEMRTKLQAAANAMVRLSNRLRDRVHTETCRQTFLTHQRDQLALKISQLHHKFRECRNQRLFAEANVREMESKVAKASAVEKNLERRPDSRHLLPR